MINGGQEMAELQLEMGEARDDFLSLASDP
jgi:hypothetical protein